MCDASQEILYVITPIFNSWRYKSRTRLYREFEAYLAQFPNVKLITVEAAFATRPYEVTSKDDPLDIQLRTNTELWHKEQMINIGISRLPANWTSVAWIDADLRFARDDWATETLLRLHHYDVVQMFSEVINLGPNNEACGKPIESFMSAYENDRLKIDGKYYMASHPGFAWAATRKAINATGGLLNIAILGSGDRHMAFGLIGKIEKGIPSGVSAGYKEQLLMWQDRAEKGIRRNVGFVPGLITHYWHGNKKNRRYNERWKILVENDYDPEFDIKPDWQDLFQFSGNKPKLEYQIRNYFKTRNEDSIDL